MQKRAGYTLLEVTAVLVVMAILLSVGGYYIADAIKQAKYTKAKEEITLLANAVSLFKYENKKYPVSLKNLEDNSKFTNAPYILPQTMPKEDPWGLGSTGIGGNLPYAYAHTDKGFAVWTFGENKQNESGGGDNTLPNSFSGDDVGIFGQN